MAEDNKSKSEHGDHALKALRNLLKQFSNNISIFENYYTGRENYDKRQFYAAFMIVFPDKKKWLLYSTTSFRSDRFKMQLWDSYNFKEIDKDVECSILVYPKNIKEKEEKSFRKRNDAIQKKKKYSTVDFILNQDELCNLIEDKLNINKNSGACYDAKGKKFQERAANLLSCKDNLEKFKTGNELITGLQYDTFLKIMNAFKINADEVISIFATADDKIIGRLPSGGFPKTDVLVKMICKDGNEKCYTISCKRTNRKKVSVHHYSANSFAKVLDPNNNYLEELLNLFQEKGCLEKFGADNCLKLTKELAPYCEKLAMWVFGGIGGDGNEKQCAQYLLTYSNEKDISIHTIQEYYQLLLKNNIKGHFGTVFSWTYPSKCRTKQIQLKSTII